MTLNKYINRIFNKLLLVVILLFVFGNVRAATVGFNKIYFGSISGNDFLFSNGSIISNVIPVSGKNFYFTDHTSNSLFVKTNNNWNGYLEYYDNSGNLVSIAGILNFQSKTGNTTMSILFTPSSGTSRYLLVVPEYEYNYQNWGLGDITTIGKVSFSADAPDINAIAAANPQIYLSFYSLPNFTTCLNTASSYKSLTVSGANLTTNVVVTAPTNFEICATSTGTYTSSLTLVKSGTSLASTTIYVKLKSNAVAGSYSGYVNFTSTSAPTQSIFLSGNVYATTSISSSPSNSIVCSSTGASFSVVGVGANLTYQWQVSTNGGGSWTNLSNTGIYLGATSSTLFLSSSLTNAYSGYQYKCVVTGSCSSATSTAATLTVNSLPSISSQPTNSTVCAGVGTNFSVTATGTSLTYQWQVSINSGSSWTDLLDLGIYTGTSSSTLSLSSSVSSSFNNLYYRCVVSGTCSPAAYSNGAILTINSAPLTPGIINGFNAICANTNQSYSIASVSGATSYTWGLPAGWTGTSTTNFINIVNGANSGTISVTATNACGTSAESTLAVVVSNLPAPTPSFTINNSTQCLSGNSFTFTDASTFVLGTSLSSINWDFGDTYTSTVSNPTHTYASANTYNVLLKVSATNGCSTSITKSVVVNPAPTATLTGSTSICAGSSSNLTVTLTGTAPWTLVYSGSPNPIVVNSSPYTLSVSPNSTTTYSLSSLSDANCSATSLTGSATITVTANNPASVVLTSNDADNSICSTNNVIFTAAPTNGGSAPSYQWLKNGSVILTTSSNTYSTTSLANNDQIAVIMTSNLATCLVGSPTQSNIITTEVHPAAPATPASISGTQQQCASLTDQVYNITNVLNASSYTWIVPTGWIITSGQGTTSVKVTTGAVSQNGDITVTANNGCGTSSAQILATTVVSTSNTISLTSASSTSSQTACYNIPISNITYSTTGTLSGATFNGLPTGINGVYSAGIVTISGTSTSTGIYNYVITSTGGSCNDNASGSITINPLNTAALSSAVGTDAQSLCISSTLTNITYSTTGATDANVTGLPSGVTGSFSGNTVTISGTPTVAGTFNYLVTLTGGCGTITKTGTITVTAANTATLTSGAGTNNQSRCVNTVISSITYSTTGATDISMFGLPSGVTVDFSSNVITISGTPTVSGTFNYTITLTGGCSNVTASGTITVSAPIDNPTIAASGSTTICSGASVVLTASSPGAGSSFVWSTGATTQSITVSSAGSYTVTVANASGCSATSEATTVVVNTLPSATISSTDADNSICAGERVTLTASAGSSFVWSTGATTQSITTSDVGSYSVTVTNASGCSATSSVTTVIVNALPSATISSTDADNSICAGEHVTLTASVGTSFVWSTGATTQSITTSNAGSYSVTVTNASGCSATSSVTTVIVNALPSATISSTDADNSICAGEHVTLTASAGTSYLWNTSASTQSITLSASGSYSVTITNASGCSATSSVTTITVNDLPTPSITGNTLVCNNATSITYSTANIAGHSYSWTVVGGVISAGSGTNSIAVNWGNAGVGTVDLIEAIIATGCYSSATQKSVTIQANPTISIASIPDITTTETSFDIPFTSTSGNPDKYSLSSIGTPTLASWSNITNATFTNTVSPIRITIGQPNTSGNYNFNIEVTNAALSCVSATYSFTVKVSSVDAGNIGSYQSICEGQVPATLTSVQLATTGSSYSWEKSTDNVHFNLIAGAISTTYSAGTLTQTTYFRRVATIGGNSANSNAVTITVNALPGIVSATITDPTCTVNTGTISVTSGTSGLSFSLSSSSGTFTNSTGVFSVLASGNYSLTSTNSTGCTSAISSLTIAAVPPSASTPLASVTDPTCTTATGTISVTSSLTGYSFSIDGSNYSNTSGVFGNINAGSYSLTAKNSNGCISTATPIVVHIQPVTSTPNNIIGNTSVCVGTTTTLSSAGVWSSTSWSSSNTSIATINTSGVVSSLLAGSSTITYTITNSSGCSSSTTTLVTVNALPGIVSATITDPTCTVNTGTISLTSGTSGLSFSLSSSSGTFTNSTGVFTGLISGNYSLTSTNNTGCTNTATNLTIHAQPLTPVVSIGSIAQITTTSTSFNIPYTITSGSPTTYALSTGTPTLSGFTNISNTSLPVSSPIIVSIPASAANTYGFTISFGNGNCISAVQNISLTITSSSLLSSTITVTGNTSYTYNGSAQGPTTSTVSGSTGAVTYSYSGIGSTTYGPSNTPPTNTGNYKVVANVASDATHNGAISSDYTFTIVAPAILPISPSVTNATYLYNSISTPSTIRGLVSFYPIGTIPVWCNLSTAVCDSVAPKTPTAIGQYIYALKSFDTTSSLYSIAYTYDTITIKPTVPIVNDSTYILGLKTNPKNVNQQFILLSNATPKYYIQSNNNVSVPNLPTAIGTYKYTISQVVNNIESDTISFKVKMIDLNDVIHLQKIVDSGKLQVNSTFNYPFKFIVTNLTSYPFNNVVLTDNLQNSVPLSANYNVINKISGNSLIVNSGYNGNTDINITTPASKLIANSKDSVSYVMNLVPNGYAGDLYNTAFVNAETIWGKVTMQSSSQTWAEEKVKSATKFYVQEIQVSIPEGFSPNHDGINDTYVIIRPVYIRIELEVFNRWGNIVYQNNDYKNDWDGKGGASNFVGLDVVDGGYFYIVKAVESSGKITTFKGSIVIQR